MDNLKNALWIEYRKAIRSRIPLFTFLGFLIFPLACALFMLIYKDPDFFRKIGLLSAKANLVGGSADWPFYLDMFAQGISGAGIMLFGLIEIWIFGREFSDGTVKDLLAVPVSRLSIIMAKFMVFAMWSILLTLVLFGVDLGLGLMLDLPFGTPALFVKATFTVLIAALLVIFSLTPIAFIASVGRGYLLPMGIALLGLGLANIAALLGWGEYFPWSIPGVFAGYVKTADHSLGFASYVVVLLTGLVGIIATFLWWKYADQHR
jgi:ABC-2 type transport system permease protein